MSEVTVKSPVKAALYSLLFGAGAGQIYNGQTKKGVFMIALFFGPVCYLIYLMLMIYFKYWQRAMAGDLSVAAEFIREIRSNEAIAANSSFAGILWIISMIDGYVSAKMINKKNGA
jgi:TM2 domain-containing membrane protein YozV